MKELINLPKFEQFVNESYKVSFKKEIAVGRNEPEIHIIKLDDKEIGNIIEITKLAMQRRSITDIGKFEISFSIKKRSTKENPNPFRYAYLTQLFDTADDAKDFVKKNFDKLSKTFDFYKSEE